VEAVKPGVVFFHEVAPEYVKLGHMQHEMTSDDVFIAIGTTFQVVSPESMLPQERWYLHQRNFLIDPEPRRAEIFGYVQPESATVGLRNLESRVRELMSAR
jgi:NAD-dependent deacetylase